MSNKTKITSPQKLLQAEKLAKYNKDTEKAFSRALKFGCSAALIHFVIALLDNSYYIRQPLIEHFADLFISAIIITFISYVLLLLKAAHKHGVLVKGHYRFSSPIASPIYTPSSLPSPSLNSSSYNPSTGLPMCGSGIDISGTPYCGSRQ